MVTVTLKPTDCIQTLLPIVEAAMESGETCKLCNIHYLGAFELAALVTLTKATHLRDSHTGRIYQAHPGFRLIGIDQAGVTRHLVN